MKGLSFNNGKVEIAHQLDALASSLGRLFFTGIGENIGNLDRGSRIMEYLYEPVDSQTATNILNEVIELIRIYEPRIKLTAVGVELTSSRGCIISIEFNWTFTTTDTSLQSLTLSSPTITA